MSQSIRPVAASQNPYAPPQAAVTGNTPPSSGGPAPALFNPDAAANWSLVFTPAFGALLHWHNWKAMGESKGLGWMIGCFIAAPISLALSAAGAPMGILFLALWYFSAARPQARYVKERWGKDYPRRSITKAVLIALAAIWGPVALLVFIGSVMN